jgi:hypothetical protein
MFERMLSIYQIRPAVMEDIMCLGSRPRVSETGMGDLAFQKGEDSCRGMCSTYHFDLTVTRL